MRHARSSSSLRLAFKPFGDQIVNQAGEVPGQFLHLVSTRQARIGEPNLATVTVSHVERLFLTVRQEVARFARQTLAYSKKLNMHTAAISMHLGIYNLCRKHTTLGTTPAVAAGLEEKPWTLEQVVDLTDAYVRRMEDAKFEVAFAAA